MFHIALYQPEIPPNTGNIIRLCANTGARLHIIQPAAFSMEDKHLRRAGLDYHEFATVAQHTDYGDFRKAVSGQRLFALSTKGGRGYHEVEYRDGDVLLFGPETRGLPQTIREEVGADSLLRVPMIPGSRSLNLANTVAVVLYEALRQRGFVFDAD